MDYKEIRKELKKLLKETLEKRSFSEGQDWVEYSGPHFDEEEYLSIFDSVFGKFGETGKHWFILGEKAKEFEDKFSNLMGKDYGTFVNSGSSANLLMVSALTSQSKKNKWKLERGDRIITPIVCFPTTLNPIIQNGLEPVFVDVELPSLNIDLDAVEQLLENWDYKFEPTGNVIPIYDECTAKGKIVEWIGDKVATNPFPKAIMFAHVLGNPPDMDRVISICEKYNLFLLEDACDALGSTYNGKPLGSFGLMSTCSFFPAHHMTTAEGGMICTNEYRLKTTLNSFRDWGRACYCNEMKPGNVTCGTACGKRFKNWFSDLDTEYDHRYVFDEIGYNLKPLELQAAIGIEQINKLPEMEAARRKNHARLTSIFEKYSDKVELQTATPNSDPCWFGFLVLVKEEEEKSKLVSFLEKNKIQTRSYFSGNILYHPGYRHLAKNKKVEQLKTMFPNAHRATTSAFFMGTFIGITDEKLDYIEKVVDRYFTEESN